MLRDDFLKEQVKRLANNFNKNWFTDDRIKLIVRYIEQTGNTEPEVERVFSFFIEHDKTPSLGMIRQRLIIEAQRSAQKHVVVHTKVDCSYCQASNLVFIKHPTEARYLVMACSFCSQDPEWSNFWGLPLYGAEYTLIDSPIKKAVTQANANGAMKLGAPIYSTLVKKLSQVCRQSQHYFKEQGLIEG